MGGSWLWFLLDFRLGLGFWFHFRSHTNIATAVAATTQALLLAVSKGIQLVVKSQLSAGFDKLLSKDSNPALVADCPFLSLAVWVTAVVDEPCVVRLLLGIYHKPIPAV